MIEEIYQCKRIFGDDIWRTKEGIAREMYKRPGLVMTEKYKHNLFAPTINYIKITMTRESLQ